MAAVRKLSDLKEAGYNPRVISSKRLSNLHKSMTTYGDLSGVVFNVKTKTLISGHQRLKPLRDAGIKVEIKTKPITDKFGTVAEGYVVAKTSAGELRIPYREVSWSDKKAEYAANIAANAHGGDFDRTKLGTLLAALEKGKSFDIDVLGLDPLSVRSLMPKMPNVEGGGDDDGESFQEYGEDSFDFEHQCPKCKFQFNSSSASKPKKDKPQPKAPKLDVKKAKAEVKAKKIKAEKKTDSNAKASKAKESLKKAKPSKLKAKIKKAK